MQKITINTKQQKEVVDITNIVNDLLRKNMQHKGMCVLNALHTTCALTTADLDPGTEEDVINAYVNMVPKLQYKHPHDPGHVGDHILSAMIGPSLAVPVEGSTLVTGHYQRVVLIEFNGPKERHITFNFIPDKDAKY